MAARERTLSCRDLGSTTSLKSRCTASSDLLPALVFLLRPQPFREVSRTRLGVPNQRSKVLPATRTPSRVEYTPKASSVSPATAEPSFALSASSSLTPLPMWPNVALMASSSFFRSSSSVSSRVLRLTSSFSRFSRMRPSASARARSRCTFPSRSDLYFSVARRSASICSATARRSASCRLVACSCSATSSWLRSRCFWCSSSCRFTARSLLYLATSCLLYASCCISFFCSSHLTLSASTAACFAAASYSACFDFASTCFVFSCSLESSMTFFAYGDLLISRSALAPRSRASGSKLGPLASLSSSQYAAAPTPAPTAVAASPALRALRKIVRSIAGNVAVLKLY
mmetsp:Transcript_18877/g.57050  ORF Transcript_18877/g.57050 Transcript_18877/m.57050 type:complete len:344 (+) Transcript_18877:3270-4301(+)